MKKLLNAIKSKLFYLYDDLSSLGIISDKILSSILNSEQNNLLWKKVYPQIQKLHLPEMTGGINPGDQRALFYLTCFVKPKRILEIGTHIGCSTIHFSMGLKIICPNQNKPILETVDIVNVNDNAVKPWLKYQSKLSPAEMVNSLKCSDIVRFHVSDSESFLKNSRNTYDLIFLDGSHKTDDVLKEIPLALKLLNKGGYILLHDYYPQGRPLWDGKKSILGPYSAVEILRKNGMPLKVIPLGILPWPTKLGSNITSLAIIGR